MAAALAIATPLVGGPSGRPLHLLTPALKRQPGGPALASKTFATAASPDGRRFATLTRRTIAIYDRRSGGRRTATFPSREAVKILWPARGRLLTLGYGSPTGSEVLRSIDLRRGRTGRAVPLDERLDLTTPGRRIRIVERSTTGLRVDEYDARARLRRRYSIPLPEGIEPGFSTASLRRNLVVLSYTAGSVAPYQHALVPLGGTAHDIDLAGAVYSFVTPQVITASGGHLARIDPGTDAVIREIDIAPDEWVVPDAGRVFVGLGRAVYDRGLDLIAAHPDAPDAAAAPIVRGVRLYARTVRCAAGGPLRGLAVVNWTNGAVVARRHRPFVIGGLGGDLSRPGEDGCD
ncbi:MAG: hypothetical protein QOF76_3517 [Solirubrobacteraceae bacterium]|nr:hypothetical protein [Solirubrobacteraceae bacterium]